MACGGISRRVHDVARRHFLDEQGLHRLLRPSGERPALDLLRRACAGALHDGRLVARCHLGVGRARRPQAGREAGSALWHVAVHRFRSDVLCRLVLGLFQHSVVPQRCRSLGLAALWYRHARPLALSAAQYASPPHLGHDGDLGTSRHPAWRQKGRRAGSVSDGAAWRLFHLHSGLRVCPRAVHLRL